MRRALIVGINDYPGAALTACVNDANQIAQLLERNHDGTPSFTCKVETAPPSTITRASLKSQITQLFAQKADIALFYFSGHGININTLGGYLVTPDASEYDEGIPMQDLLTLANKSQIQEVVIIL